MRKKGKYHAAGYNKTAGPVGGRDHAVGGATTCAIPHFSMRFALGVLRVGAILIPFSGYVGAFFDARLAT